MSIGSKLRKLRGNRTIQDVAELLGVTMSAYTKYERDERVPRDEVKIRIAKLYGKTVGEIFFAEVNHKREEA